MVDEVIVGIFTLTGVILGAFLGLGLNLLKDHLQERKQRTKYLMDLLSDFEYNKKLAGENKKWGYHTLGYTDAKGAKYTFDLPEKLRMQIYDIQSMISANIEKGETARIKEIKKLLDNVIPEFKEYLKCESIGLKRSSSYFDETKHGPDEEKRLDKFDNLLLFASSLMGYLFVIIQFIFGKTAIVLLFAPLLIFGLIFPFILDTSKGHLANHLNIAFEAGFTFLSGWASTFGSHFHLVY